MRSRRRRSRRRRRRGRRRRRSGRRRMRRRRTRKSRRRRRRRRRRRSAVLAKCVRHLTECPVCSLVNCNIRYVIITRSSLQYCSAVPKIIPAPHYKLVQ